MTLRAARGRVMMGVSDTRAFDDGDQSHKGGRLDGVSSAPHKRGTIAGPAGV